MILLSAQPREDKEPEHRVKDLVTFPIRNQARAPRLGWLGTHGRPQTRDVGAGLQAAAKSVQGRGGQVAVFPAPTPYYPEVCSGPHTSEGARLGVGGGQTEVAGLHSNTNTETGQMAGWMGE